MNEILLTGLLYYLLLACLSLFVRRHIRVDVLVFSACYFAGLVTLAILNFHFDVFEQKFAGQMAYERWLGIETRLNGNFGVQAVFSSIGFYLTDAWYAAIGVNVAIIATLILTVDRLRYVYTAIFLSPAILHISIFSLRDVVIGFSLFLLCQILFSGRKNALLYASPIIILLFFQRPELTAVIFATLGLLAMQKTSALTKIAVVIGGSITLAITMPYIPLLLGAKSAVPLAQLPEYLLIFSEARSDRHLGTEGADAAVLNGQLTQIPFLLRYPLQLFTFFIAPLPTDFRGMTSIILTIDSLIFIGLFVIFWRIANHEHRTLMLVYVLANGFFVANYGNLFRLRMLCYFILLSGIALAYKQAAQARRLA